jgi:hypothetical protein
MVQQSDLSRKGLVATMFTEQILHENPGMIKAFMGIPAEVFWMIVQVVDQVLPDLDHQRLQRPDRQRAPGAGRRCDQPIVIRVAAVLTYLRLYAPQIPVALMYGMTQPDLSRDLRRIVPALHCALPCPEVWKVLEDGQELSDTDRLALTALAQHRVLVDATEQRTSRSSDNDTRKAYYSGKKKQFTLKTQFVVDGEHHIHAISESVPGAEHDKTLSDELQTLEHLPDDCEVDADKGYQGLDKQVRLVTVIDPETERPQEVARLTVQTPYKKPKGGELTDAQRTFNASLNAIRVRVEHCLGWAKNWAILAIRFRCAHSIYSSIMRAICGLVNLQTQRWQATKATNSA